MKAVVYTKYGPPEVLQLKELEKPVPKDDEVLIKIHAASVTAVDCTFRKGSDFFARLFTGPLKPKRSVPGGDLAGEVEAVGKNVQSFKKGDRVIAVTSDGFGAHAGHICLPQDGALITIPANMNYAEAAAIPYGFLTALPFLRDTAHIQSGQKILINGASGGIGALAVQLAKYFGAEVSGVCSTANSELVRSLGCDKVIDYTKVDFTEDGEIYDIIFDTAGKSSFGRGKKVLKQKGIYLTPVLTFTILFQMLLTSKSSGKKAVIAFTGLRSTTEKVKDLIFFRELLEAGKIKAVVDRTYTLENIAEAHGYVEGGHKKGSVVVEI